ncbi:MAG: class I SAM-dependent methyltransferase [Actinomycetota bacterium]
MLKFDTAYYQRFYGDNGAHDAEKVAHLATAVHHLAAWWGVEVSTVLDVGAGMGMWRDWYNNTHPSVTVRSIDISEHACKTWHHEQRDISQWRPRGKFDLVVCHSVLQYLNKESVIQAFEHLAAATRHVLYLELPTKWDYENICDETSTDLQVYQRSGTWYRTQLSQYFRQVGAGLWVPQNGIPMYELEACR